MTVDPSLPSKPRQTICLIQPFGAALLPTVATACDRRAITLHQRCRPWYAEGASCADAAVSMASGDCESGGRGGKALHSPPPAERSRRLPRARDEPLSRLRARSCPRAPGTRERSHEKTSSGRSRAGLRSCGTRADKREREPSANPTGWSREDEARGGCAAAHTRPEGALASGLPTPRQPLATTQPDWLVWRFRRVGDLPRLHWCACWAQTLIRVASYGRGAVQASIQELGEMEAGALHCGRCMGAT